MSLSELDSAPFDQPESLMAQSDAAQFDEARFDEAQFDRTIGDLTAALGDPTRRAIYIAVRQSAEPLTSTQVADIFEIHPNVARHHLDKLAGDGYLRVTQKRLNGRRGPGAGRPAKCYEATGKAVAVHPGRRYDLLVDLLVKVIDRLHPDAISATAEAVGRDYGKALAAEIGAPDDAGYAVAVEAVAKAMGGLGFDITADVGSQRLLTSHCPFGAAATAHPEVICSLDRGIVSGILGSLSQPCSPVLTPHRTEAEDCVTSVPVAISARV
ncbi:MAG TPA: helix-turn-helix domain-containing protein [Acidimicrobiia bacterium]|jgi:predicted ArsR family transcriptional regulator